MDILDKKFSIKGLLEFSTYCLLLITGASLFDEKSRYLELLSHFKSQYFFSSLIFLVLLLRLKTYKAAMASFVALLINFFFILPLYISPDFVENNSEGLSLKVIISNVYTANLEYQKIIDLVNEEAPDILVLQEVDSNWASRLEELKDILPYSIVRPRNDNFGIALFSRHKPLKQAVVQWGNIEIPSIESQFEIGNNVFHILATHPLPPVSSINYKYRNEQLFDVSVRAKQITEPKIIMGDLNITTWSDDYKKLENDTGLKNARNGFGILPT